MDVAELIADLSRPEAYAHPVADVEVVQTHISVVFLAGARAYKVKKPVDLGFLDFTTLDRRRQFCQAEVELNSRGAPDVYLGVMPVTLRDGRAVFGGAGETVDYAVVMRRLSNDRTLAHLLAQGAVEEGTVARLGARIALFHRMAAGGPTVSPYGDWPGVAGNVRENFEQLRPYVSRSISPGVYDRLLGLSETALAEWRPLIEARARSGMTRDTHGDLHLEHVYWLPGHAQEFLLVDCIEFNERFRYADPVADLAFLVMDLKAHGHPDLARCLADAYFESAQDPEGRSLLPFYTAYRAVVRGKVASFSLDQPTIEAEAKARALGEARRRFVLALGELAPPPHKPCLVLVAGLPGTGKTAVAEGLVRSEGFVRVASDLERKRLAGVPPGQEALVRLDEGGYTSAAGARTYEACLERAAAHLAEGHRVVVDATFRERKWRQRFASLARDWSVPWLLMVCQLPADVVRARLAARALSGGDASDADWSVYQKLASSWEPPTAEEVPSCRLLDTSADLATVVSQARQLVDAMLRLV